MVNDNRQTRGEIFSGCAYVASKDNEGVAQQRLAFRVELHVTVNKGTEDILTKLLHQLQLVKVRTVL